VISDRVGVGTKLTNVETPRAVLLIVALLKEVGIPVINGLVRQVLLIPWEEDTVIG